MPYGVLSLDTIIRTVDSYTLKFSLALASRKRILDTWAVLIHDGKGIGGGGRVDGEAEIGHQGMKESDEVVESASGSVC